MRPFVPVIALAVLLAGCGYKTPLTLPKPEPGAKPAAQKPAPGENDKKPASEP
jgi:predicted small lipoprotein YifL